ncbi:hypothetical protein MKX01_011037 [Papaver californicum]|nr:hypothetical protein MKX01_011037 [Papaver californicum]
MKNIMDSNCGEVVDSKTTNSLMMRVVVFVSFVGFFIIVNEVTIIPLISTSEEPKPLSLSSSTTRTSTSTSSSLGNSNGRHSSSSTPPTTPRGVPKSYMASKRRVPNGPDPIHNRRARKSKEPPGRA